MKAAGMEYKIYACMWERSENYSYCAPLMLLLLLLLFVYTYSTYYIEYACIFSYSSLLFFFLLFIIIFLPPISSRWIAVYEWRGSVRSVHVFAVCACRFRFFFLSFFGFIFFPLLLLLLLWFLFDSIRTFALLLH